MFLSEVLQSPRASSCLVGHTDMRLPLPDVSAGTTHRKDQIEGTSFDLPPLRS